MQLVTIIMSMTCLIYNYRAKKEFTQRNFLQFLGKIKSNANTPYQHTPITSEDVTRIKTMRKDNYAKMERNWLALKCVVGGLCKVKLLLISLYTINFVNLIFNRLKER